MKTTLQWLAVAAVVLGGQPPAPAAVTNTAPWQESFETYGNGTLLSGTNGWTATSQADAGVVTNLATVVDLLTNYPVSGRSLPLAGTHTNVAVLNAELANEVHGASGGVVRVDFMALPGWADAFPAGDTNRHYGISIWTNGHLAVWHNNRVAGSNEWLVLGSSPVVSTGAWSRFTVVADYSNHLFQVAVNEGAPITDAAGWTGAGGSHPGSWFNMVKTNGVLSRVLAEAAPAYVDDLVLARRSLGWSRTNFRESVSQHGLIDNSSPLVVTLANDTFAGAVGADLAASGRAVVTGLASNLAAVVQLTASNQVSVTLTNSALDHDLANSLGFSLQFADGAFTLGRAWDVAGSQTNLAVDFTHTPRLGYSTNSFHESATNNGTVDNSAPVLITLTNALFAGTAGENFAANSAKLVVSNVPAGLSAEVLYVSSTQLEFRLAGTAAAHAVANDLADLALAFQDGAFVDDPASFVYGAATNFSVAYTDPGELVYGTTVFPENVANNGTVDGTWLSLANKAFSATNGEDLAGAGKATVANLPAGLGLKVVRGATATNAAIVFTGAAGAHAALDSVGNLGLTFLDAAFVGGNASAVANYSIPYLQVNFADARILAYSGTSFTEVSGGAIDNRSPRTITLTGDTLTGADGDDFVAAGKVTAANVPAGLAAVVTRDSSARLSIRFTGLAAAHASGDSVSNVRLTFQDGAFTGGHAVYVTGYDNTGIGIAFVDDTGFYNVIPYAEPFESYLAGTLIPGTNGWAGSSTDAGVVTNGAGLASALAAYATPEFYLPIASATHTQALRVQETLKVDVHSEAATNVVVDFLAVPVAMGEAPLNDASNQWAFYVSTNRQLVVWQQTRAGGPPVNEWITLTNAEPVSTSAWVRFTVEADYVNDLFRVRVNQKPPITDPRAWTAAGGSLGGSWLYMVQTNHAMASFRMTGLGEGLIEDLRVDTALPESFFIVSGSIFIYR